MTTRHDRVAGLKRLTPLLLKLAVTGGMLAYVFTRADIGAISHVVGQADPALLALAVVVLCINYGLGGLRWWSVVRGLGQVASPLLLTGLFWLGGLAGQFLPNPLGDAVRVSVAARRGLGLGTAIRSALFERGVMVMALLVLIAATEPMLRARVGHAAPTRLVWLLFAGGVVGMAGLAVADHLLAPLRRFKVMAMLSELAPEFRRLLASRWVLAVAVAALLANLNLFLSAGIVGAALALPLSHADYLAIMPVATVATVVPVSIGGWGVREGVLIAVLGAMGVPAGTALAFSLLYGICIAASSLPGLAMLWRRGPLAVGDTQ